ncbi:hypothetical protein BSKO_08995 [Bryopsis sp. KO-2023]|nr:hypothetical protein BSKO_08995 [Bryopsis sp. KO-2023]
MAAISCPVWAYMCLALATCVASMSTTCEDNPHTFLLELWRVGNDTEVLTDELFEDDPLMKATFGQIEFNEGEETVWEPFRDLWDETDEFNYFAVKATAQICPCEDMTLLLFVSSDDGSRLYLDGERVINMNHMQSITAEITPRPVELRSGQCVDLELQYFDADSNQFLNLAYWQIFPPPPQDRLSRAPLKGDQIFNPTCSVPTCEERTENPPPEEPPPEEDEQPGEQEVDDPIPDDDDDDQTCPSRTLDGRGNCCSSTVKNKDNKCCEEENPVRDMEGLCCTSELLDVCGVCNGTSTGIDVVSGVCCSALDGNGECCDLPSVVDDCGICGGDGRSCDMFQRIRMERSAMNPTQRKLLLQGSGRELLEAPAQSRADTDDLVDVDSTEDAPREAPGPNDDACDVELPTLEELHSSIVSALNIREARVNLTAVASECGVFELMVERPTVDGDDTITSADLQERLAGLAAGGFVLRITETGSIGVCKNHLCEFGERLHSGTPWECPEDCENVVPQCVEVEGLACGKFGLCDRGKCDCFEGYQGDDCTRCKSGYEKVADTCQPSNSVPPPPPPETPCEGEGCNSKSKMSDKTKKILIGVGAGIGGTALLAGVIVLVYKATTASTTTAATGGGGFDTIT